jgi:hypothetical protein
MGGPTIAQVLPILANLPGFTQDIVINIGNILSVPNQKSFVFEITDQNIRGGISKGMPEMGRVVWGDPADINAD